MSRKTKRRGDESTTRLGLPDTFWSPILTEYERQRQMTFFKRKEVYVGDSRESDSQDRRQRRSALYKRDKVRSDTSKVQSKPGLPRLVDERVSRIFEEDREGLICSRRKARREILHALGHAGKGGQRPPRWTDDSKVRCRRKK